MNIKIAFIASTAVISGGADGIRAYNQLREWSESIGRENIDLFIVGDAQKQFTEKQLSFELFRNNITFIPIRKGILGDFYRLFILKRDIVQKVVGNYDLVLSIDMPVIFNETSLNEKTIKIFDIHGAIEEERLLTRSFPKNILIAKNIGRELRKSLLNSDILIASSKALIEYYKNKYTLTFDKEFIVYNYPNLHFQLSKKEILENRTKTRERLNMSETTPLLTYIGGTQKWQSLDLLFKTVRALIKVNPHIRFLVLTNNPDLFRNLLKKKVSSTLKAYVRKVNHREVPKYLCAADLGLVIRENNLVNNVSTPTKFGEYLSCGVPVLITRNLEEYARFTLEKDLGFVIGHDDNFPNELIEFLKYFNLQLRLNFIERNTSFVQREFNWDIYKEKVIFSILQYVRDKTLIKNP